MAKHKVVNIATRDSIFSVHGSQDDVIARVVGCHDEYIEFEVPHPDGGWTRCMVLNRPREVVMIGSEHAIEMDEHGKVVVKQAEDPRTARVALE